MSAVGMCFHVWWTETSVRCTSLLKLSSPRLCLVSNQSASPSQIVSHPSDVCSLQAGSTSCSSVSLWTSSSLSWPNLASSTHSPFTYSIELNIMNPLLRNNREKKGAAASCSRRQFLRATVQKSSLVYLCRLKTHVSRLHQFPPPHHPQPCGVRIQHDYNMLQLFPQINVTLILSGDLVLRKNSFLFCFIVHDTPWKQDGVTQRFYQIRISLKHWKMQTNVLEKSKWVITLYRLRTTVDLFTAFL